MARGLLPVKPPARRIGCATSASRRRWPTSWPREGAGVEHYVDELRERNPFKTGGAGPAGSTPIGE